LKEDELIDQLFFLRKKKKLFNLIFSSPILASFTMAFNGLSAWIRIEEINYKNIKPCVPKSSVLLATTTMIIIILLLLLL
jgi:hypothetical protein